MPTWRLILDLEEPGHPNAEVPPVLVLPGDLAIDPAEASGSVVVRICGSSASLSTPEYAGSSRPLDTASWTQAGPWRLQARPLLSNDHAKSSNQPDLFTPRLLVREPGAGPREIVLNAMPEPGLVFGRRGGPGDIALNDRHVSARHFRIARAEGRHRVIDLDSRHGTFVNGVRVRGARVLHHQDVITAGSSRVDFLDLSEHVRKTAIAVPDRSPDPADAEDPNRTLDSVPAEDSLESPAIDADEAARARSLRRRRGALMLVVLVAAVAAGALWVWALGSAGPGSGR